MTILGHGSVKRPCWDKYHHRSRRSSGDTFVLFVNFDEKSFEKQRTPIRSIGLVRDCLRVSVVIKDFGLTRKVSNYPLYAIGYEFNMFLLGSDEILHPTKEIQKEGIQTIKPSVCHRKKMNLSEFTNCT